MTRIRNFYILLGWLCLLVCGCTPHEPRFVVGVSQCSNDKWREQMNKEIKREALFYPEVQVEIRSANDNNQTQIEDIRSFIAQGVDLLIVSPNESEAITPVVEEAFDKGIPVVLCDRKIQSEKYSAYIGADNYEIGYKAGEYIVGRLQGKGKLVEIMGLKGSSPAVERHKGLVEALKQAPEITLVASADAAWLQQPAFEAVDSILSRFPEIDMIFTQNDFMAKGAYLAAENRGRQRDRCACRRGLWYRYGGQQTVGCDVYLSDRWRPDHAAGDDYPEGRKVQSRKQTFVGSCRQIECEGDADADHTYLSVGPENRIAELPDG